MLTPVPARKGSCNAASFGKNQIEDVYVSSLVEQGAEVSEDTMGLFVRDMMKEAVHENEVERFPDNFIRGHVGYDEIPAVPPTGRCDVPRIDVDSQVFTLEEIGGVSAGSTSHIQDASDSVHGVMLEDG